MSGPASATLHQIEYRWVPVKDMSPVASSLPPDMTARWDPLIRPWVRHPADAKLAESVCYQVLPLEVAALAWRFRDSQAAEREDGTQGRPLVSRVLIGSSSLLTPDLAVRLCRSGLPELAGPRPGRFDPGEGVPAIDVTELLSPAADEVGELDKAAAQEKGLQQVLAAALSDPGTPLGIQLRDPFIFQPLRIAPQSPLLWGMWRTAEALLGPDGRGWSFSTFELPMGSQDPSTLPAIVFRQTQSASGPPASSRHEVRVRPGDLSAPATPLDAGVVELAGWLTEEYRQAGGDGLKKFIAACGARQSLEAQREVVLEKLRVKYSPRRAGPGATVLLRSSGPGTMPGSADIGESDVPGSLPADGEPEYAGRQGASQQERRKPDFWEVEYFQDASGRWQETQPSATVGRLDPALDPESPGEAEESVRADASGDQGSRQAAASGPDLPAARGTWPELAGTRQPTVPGIERRDVVPAERGRVYRIEALFRRLEREQDDKKFRQLLEEFLTARSKFEERVAVRRQLSATGWSIGALQQHGFQDYVPVLAQIFFVLVLPDLEHQVLASQLSDWVRKGPPEVTAALLIAASDADEGQRTGGKKFQLMTAALGEAGLQKLLEVSNIPFDWPPSRRGAGTGTHSRPGFFARILYRLGLTEDPGVNLPEGGRP